MPRTRRTSQPPEKVEPLLRSKARVYFGSSAFGTLTAPGFYEPDVVPFATRMKMRKDPMIALGLWTIKAPLCVSDFTIECEDPTVKAFVSSELKSVWSKLIRTSLLMLDFGWSPHEKVFEVADRLIKVHPPIENTDGEELKRPKAKDVLLKNMICLKSIKDICPGTLNPLYDGPTDEFIGIQQHQPHGEKVTIPKDRLYMPVFQEEWGDKTGRALLDSAYRPWYHSYVVEQLWARYMERRTIPPLIGTAPVGRRQDPESGEEYYAEDAMLTILQNLHHGNAAYLPHEPDATTRKNAWGVEALQFFAQTDQFQTFQATMDGRMLRGLLVPEKALIQGTKVGTLSETDAFTDTFLTGLDTLINYLQGVIQGIVDDLVKLNFAPRPCCVIRISEISSQRRKSLSEMVSLLLEASDVNSHGVEYKFSDLIDLKVMAGQLGIPIRDPDEVLLRKKEDEPQQPGSQVPGDRQAQGAGSDPSRSGSGRSGP